jgi:tRNA dimethylallyltransferase
MDDMPVISPEIRKEVITSFQEKGLGWLQEQVRILDPGYYEGGEILNPQRMMRALEVILSTGKSIKHYHTRNRKTRNFNVVKIGLELPKSILYNQVNSRVDEMVNHGLVDEVKSLVPFQHLNALNTVGYKEIFAFINGTYSLPESIDLVKKNTRHYAKRQMTWFKKDQSVFWIHPHDYSGLIEYAGAKGIYLPPWSDSK